MGIYSPAAYATLHDGVRVVHAHLKTPEGQAALHDELARTDVLITSFRPSALTKLGLATSSGVPFTHALLSGINYISIVVVF